MADSRLIEINGKSFDAITGRRVGRKPLKRASPNLKKQSAQKAIRKSIDGLIRTTKRTPASLSKPKLPTQPKKRFQHPAPVVKLKERVFKLSPLQITSPRRKPQHSKTLIRASVRRPEFKPTKTVKLASRVIKQNRIAPAVRKRLEHVPRPTNVVSKVPTSLILEKARRIKQSQLVSRFGEIDYSKRHLTRNKVTLAETATTDIHQKNLERLAEMDTNPEDEDVFAEEALKLASSHKNLIRKRTPAYVRLARRLRIMPRTLLLSTVGVIVLAFCAFAVYHYYDYLVVDYANLRIHFNGHLAGVTTPGFSVSKINYTKNDLIFSYSSNSGDGRGYQIFEQPSDWDSQSLLDSVVNPNVSDSYANYQIGGRTVYEYAHTAVWVDGGIYYRINNDANLSSSQLTSIINSL
ncbi:MAG TPA: hypothetical protein VMR34_01250 [Candidatus Saccharimonadales bacterium]|nr:hypothetical protein [Candidatus Saccharimonadales bacterium]